MRRDLAWSRPALVLTGLCVLALISMLCFMTLGVRGNWGFVLEFRGRKLLGLLLVAYSVAVSTALFQTIANNRILTPALMGFDSLYLLIQTTVMALFGARTFALMDPRLSFAIDAALMVGFSMLLFRWLFLGQERSLHLLVLVGIVFGVLFRSLANFMQRMLDPNAFQVLQDSFFASFSNIDASLLGISWAILGVATLVLWRMGSCFDVLALGKAQAISLGVDHRRVVFILLTIIAVLVAVSTALVGPISFFGLLVVSLARLAIGESRHRFLLPASVLLAVVCLVGGQTLLERVFNFNTALSIVVEFLGGIVFIVMVTRGAAR